MRPLHRPRHRAFTLVELLVVIGIIALLIAILLPALSKARKSANTVKCLSNLRSIGQGYALYAVDFKNTWPVAVHTEKIGTGWQNIPQERRWYDLIYPYVGGSTNVEKTQDIDKIRRNSVLWGCPEWYKSNDFDPNDSTQRDKLRVGYGMQYYPTYFEDGKQPQHLAYINQSGGLVFGEYPRVSAWTKAADRGLVADSVTHIIGMNGTVTQLASTNTWYDMDPSIAAPDIYVDAGRHGPKKHLDQYNSPCLNMLFCDGHVVTVSVRQAWNAIHNPGQDNTLP
jgi:prepilin-type N-terminal cleavage/methylation domain-containing protein/prepilin-type processing-associated H-X9-DG protein